MDDSVYAVYAVKEISFAVRSNEANECPRTATTRLLRRDSGKRWWRRWLLLSDEERWRDSLDEDDVR